MVEAEHCLEVALKGSLGGGAGIILPSLFLCPAVWNVAVIAESRVAAIRTAMP